MYQRTILLPNLVQVLPGRMHGQKLNNIVGIPVIGSESFLIFSKENQSLLHQKIHPFYILKGP